MRLGQKRLKMYNGMNGFSSPNSPTVGDQDAKYRKSEDCSPNKFANCPDPLALPNLLKKLADVKYGSVTKEYESLHAHMTSVLSALKQSFLSSRTCQVSPSSTPGLDHDTNSAVASFIDDQHLSVVAAEENDRSHDQIVRQDSSFDDSAAQNKMLNVTSSPHGFPITHEKVESVWSHDQIVTQDSSVDDSAAQNKMTNCISRPQDFPITNDKANVSVIVIDSDEEDTIHQKNAHASNSGYEPPNKEVLAIQLWQPDQQKGIHEDHVETSLHEYYYDQVDASQMSWQPSIQYQKVDLTNITGSSPYQDLVGHDQATPVLTPFSITSSRGKQGSSGLPTTSLSPAKKRKRGRPVSGSNKPKSKKSEVYDGEATLRILNSDKAIVRQESNVTEGPHSVDDMLQQSPSIESSPGNNSEVSENDGLEDLWKEMSFAMECSKSATPEVAQLIEQEDECDHSFVLKDDLGLVCRICGLIQKSIEKIFDYQWPKGPGATRIYSSECRNSKDLDETILFSGPKLAEYDLVAAEIAIHPRHVKQMKPHQLEGFAFLVRNLVSDKPGGCILAHAPGSGKTFMLISFIQSFLGKYPFARTLVVLPKGILSTWKKEFQKWQVEEIPLYDFYSLKADNRFQQLEVLKTWEENKSILFLGYKQFANIVCESTTSNVATACKEILLKVPSLLIIDEGHTPRNDDTNMVTALANVQTPRKVVLSGTLFQNHVKEVFTILNLVRPKFLKMEASRAVVRRIMSRVSFSRRQIRTDTVTAFYELVEEALQNDSDFQRKITVIRDLREMTKDVLHYYKGDFLEELPGIVDFTILLNLSVKQRSTVQKLGKLDKFKRYALCKSIYMHPYLNEISENASGDKRCDVNEDKIDNLIDRLDIRDGVKTKFFMNVLSMSVAAGEKLLVFSQYLLPLKFLEKLLAKMKGWRSGKEMFMISGDSSTEQREWSMEQFNTSSDSKILFGSIKACGEGISLVGASRVVILDVHLNPSVSRQAIGRAFRPGQMKKVYVYRLVAADSTEEEDHNTSFRKELISKMWFEWSEYSGVRDFELGEVDVHDCEDLFFENPNLVEDIKALYRR